MAKYNHGATLRKHSFRVTLLTGVFLGTSVLGACSSVPDAINPVEWYKGTVDLFAGDKASKDQADGKTGGLAADRGKAPPGSDKSFPNLASVDQQARARDIKGGGLSADTERPKYAPAIRRQGQSTEAPAAPAIAAAAPKSVIAATQPPPPAVPSAPVRPVPMSTPSVMAKASPRTPILAPPNLTIEQKEVEQRLARQLAEIRAEAEVGSANTRFAAPGAAPSGQRDTIVISSDGVESASAAMEMAARAETMPMTQSPPSSASASNMVNAPATGAVTKVATILFDNGSSRLKANDKQILSAVKRLQRKRGGTIRIVGHASTRTRNMAPIKHMMANFKISIDRADRVVGELVRLGLKKQNIEVAAVSDRQPIYYEFMPSGEAGNRRTEIFLVN